MLRAPLRTLPRRLPVQIPIQRFASSSAPRRGVHQSQTQKPIVVASLGLVALFGWTAVILSVGNKKDKHAVVEKVKEKVQEGELLHLV